MEGCNPDRVVPLVNLHGTADTIMPFRGSDQFGQSDCEWLLSSLI